MSLVCETCKLSFKNAGALAKHKKKHKKPVKSGSLLQFFQKHSNKSGRKAPIELKPMKSKKSSRKSASSPVRSIPSIRPAPAPPKGHGVQLLDAICTILISRPLSRFRRDTSEEESDEFVIPRRTVQAPKLAKPRVQKKKVVIPKKNPARSVPPLKRKIEELVPGPPPGPPPKRMRPSASSIPSRK